MLYPLSYEGGAGVGEILGENYRSGSCSTLLVTSHCRARLSPCA